MLNKVNNNSFKKLFIQNWINPPTSISLKNCKNFKFVVSLPFYQDREP